MKPICLLALAMLASPALAADTAVRLLAGTERLSNGAADWTERGIGVQQTYGARRVLDLSASDVHRFGLHDSQVAASYTLPLSASLTATVEANASGTHRVLARHAFGVQLQAEVAPAWLVHGGLRSSRFDNATVNGAQLAVERYTGPYSLLLGWRPTRAYGETAHGIELRASRYYGERNALTLILAGGKEAASIPGGVTLTGVRSAALTGRHWLDAHWALSYGVSHTRQGSLYTRKGINLGLQYAF